MKFLVNQTMTVRIKTDDLEGMATISFNLVKESEDGQFGYDLATDDILNYDLLGILNDIKCSEITRVSVEATPITKD